MSGLRKADAHFSTKAIHCGNEPENWTAWPAVPMISMATTFKQRGPKDHEGFEYGRSDNPTRKCLETCLAAIENAKYGLCFSSGLSAADAVVHLLIPGDHILCVDDVYGGVRRLLSKVASKLNIHTSFVDPTNPEKFVQNIKENTKIIWLESPTNPTLKLVDIEKISSMVKQKRPDIHILVDNTFMSSYFQQPIDLGATIVLHSITKYLNGHSDVIMGCLCLNDSELYDKLKYLQNAMGGVPSPFDCYLVNRGLKTLAVRMKGHMYNTLALAKFLEKHPQVEKVIYPGLESHPQYELAKRQCSGFSGILSFYVKGGLEETVKFLKNLKLFIIAESLGSYESLIDHPALMTHESVPPEDRKLLGITDNLVRLSVGLEDTEDIINDLDQALKSIAK